MKKNICLQLKIYVNFEDWMYSVQQKQQGGEWQDLKKIKKISNAKLQWKKMWDVIQYINRTTI